MRRQHLHQAAYGLWFLMPLTPVLAVSDHFLALSDSVAAWLPLLILFGGYPVIQMSLPFTFPDFDALAKKESRSWQFLYNVINWLSFPLVAWMLIAGAEFWSTADLDPFSAAAYAIAIGAFNSFISLNIGHELLHAGNHISKPRRNSKGAVRSQAWMNPSASRILGAIALSTACFGTFTMSHINIHHKFVGTAKDYHTAQRGQSIYEFMMRALAHEAVTGIRWARRILTRKAATRGDRLIILSTVLSCTWAFLFYLGWGWRGLAFFLIQSAVGIVFVEWVNYLQHYGIVRGMNASGQLQPVADWHAWNEDLWLSDIYMLGLLKHVDHHVSPGRPYLCLSRSDQAPSYPYPLTLMVGISLVPPLFFSIADRILDSHPLLARRADTAG